VAKPHLTQQTPRPKPKPLSPKPSLARARKARKIFTAAEQEKLFRKLEGNTELELTEIIGAISEKLKVHCWWVD
jgi:hypothetical protein